jgi:FixJ family two-component response regulator
MDRLSPREREVVAKIVEGQSTKEIAADLNTSVKTVEKQRRDAMRKLDVDSIASLVRVCLQLGLKN